MLRLKDELETCFVEDRIEAVHKLQHEHIEDVNQLKEAFAFREKLLQDEIDAIKLKLVDRNRRLDEANEKADKQIMQIRMILNKSEQGHQREFHSQSLQHEREMGKIHAICNQINKKIKKNHFIEMIILDQLRIQFEKKEAEMNAQFEAKLDELRSMSSNELQNCKAEMIAKLKRDYG